MTTANATATAPESTITVTPVEGDELFHQYRGESAPQRCHVTLDCESGALGASYDGEIGSGVPMRVYNSLVRRWRIPALTEGAANALLAEIAPEAERVVAGFERVWDGNNHVGRFDADAEEAIEVIARLCDRDWSGETIEQWDAADYYAALGGHGAQRRQIGITAETTDEELAGIADREEKSAAPHRVEGIAAHLTALRDEAAAESDED